MGGDVYPNKAAFTPRLPICHTGPVNPDLFRSAVSLDRDAWHAVVMEGVLADNGMISFAPWIDAGQSEAIRGYVLQQANARAGQQRRASGSN